MRWFRIGVIVVIVAVAAVFLWLARSVRPNLVMIDAEPYAIAASGRVDHSPFENLLARFLRADGSLDYASWHADPASRNELDRYLATLSKVSPRSAPASYGDTTSAIAYYINAYHAAGIAVILRAWPVRSIREIGPDPDHDDARGFFRRNTFLFGGSQMTLYGLVCRWLADLSPDPAVACAIGGFSPMFPPVPKSIPTGPSQPSFFAEQARAFVNSPGVVTLDEARQRVLVSPAFFWRHELFARSSDEADPTPDIRALCERFAAPDLRASLLRARKWELAPAAADLSIR